MSDEIHTLAAPYALDALPEAEERRFEEHLASCTRCREELGSLKEAAASLAYAAAGPAPPPELKERILTQARGERDNVASLPARRRNWTRPLSAAAAIAASVAIGLGVWTATRPSEGNAFTRVLAQPGARLMEMGAQGAVAVAPNGEAALILRVPPAPAGKTYEAWVMRPDTIEPAGVFRGNDGTTVLTIPRHVPRGSVIGVTVERAGGVDQPTQKPFVATEATT
ncbi:MAG TPA: anti-sigma factor [Gaiellaceae bacterium]|nr:anti-sigma factor [Gaiellaceae bacterium]